MKTTDHNNPEGLQDELRQTCCNDNAREAGAVLPDQEAAIRSTEARLSAFLEFIPALILIKDHEFRTIFANQNAWNLFPFREWMGKKPHEIFSPEIADLMVRKDSEAITAGYTHYEEEWIDIKNISHTFFTEKFRIDIPGSSPLLGSILTDITEKKRVLNALEESEKKYRMMAEYSADVIWILNTEARFTYISPSVLRLRGYTPEEVLHQDLEEVMTQASAEMVRNAMLGATEAIRKGTLTADPVTFELEKLCRDGSTVWTESLAQPMFDDKGYLTGFVGISRDINERRQSQEALRLAEQRSRALIEHAPDGIVMVNSDGRFTYASPPATNMFGFSSEDLEFESPDDLTHPDDLPMVLQTLGGLMQDPSLVPTIQYRFRHKNGSWLWIESTFSNLIGTPGIDAIVINFRDITDRKMADDKIRESEHKSRKLSHGIEQSPAAVIITGPTGLIEYVNPKFTAMTGYTPERVEGKIARILKRGRTPEDVHMHIWQTITSGKVWEGEYLSTRITGEQYWESVSVAPILDPAGLILNFIITIEDISERKKMITDLVNARLKAEESDKLKSAFLANMSHEIRTPMNAIVGFAEMLSDPELTAEERNKFTGIIQTRSDDLMHIINDLLEISRIESGNVSIIRNKFQINAVLAEVEAVFGRRLERSGKKDLELRVEMALPDHRSVIFTDPYILRQVFSNLIENAIKYTPSGCIRFGYLPPEDGQVTFFVRDTGIGISRENQTVIFEHFRQADIENPHQYSGTGLGLAICRGSLALVKGSIRVESEPGQGSVFLFTLPFNPGGSVVEPAGIAEVDESQPAMQENHYNWKGRNILVVEDEPTNLEFLKILLKPTRISVTSAENGARLREQYDHLDHYCMVLLDVRLPDASGWKLAREIKAIRPDLPVNAQTAYAMQSDHQKSLEAGCDNYISKPINKEQLLNMMSGYLKNQASPTV